MRSKILKEFIIDDKNVYVSLFSGDELSAPVETCSFYYQIDKDKMMDVEIKSGDQQVSFMELGLMLDDDNWKEIKKYLEEHRTETFDFVTHEPTTFQKFLQVYWLIPKSHLLEEFRYDGTNLYVSNLKGKEISAPLSECTIQHELDGYKRMEIIIKHGDEKLRIREMPFMLDDAEWGTIKHFVLDICKSKMTLSGKIGQFAREAKEVLDD